jgi:hypothetical protein
MEIKYHKQLAESGRWFEFSYNEQMGNIGSEVGRSANWRGKDQKNFQGAVNRALELFDLTLEDPRWKGREKGKEVVRVRELFCRAVESNNKIEPTFEDLDRYFLEFALAARQNIQDTKYDILNTK